MPGLTPTGFETKRLEDVVDSLKDRAAVAFGANINTEDDAVMGQIIDVMSSEFVSLWELAEAVYNGFVPSGAEGAQLDDVSSVVGVARQPATKSRVNVTLQGDIGTVIISGTTFSKSTDSAQFETDAPATFDLSSLTGIIISINTVTDLFLYTVTIGSTAVDFTSDGTATDLEIAAGLVSAINLDPVTSLSVLATDNLDGTFTIRTLDILTGTAFAVTAELTVDKGLIPDLSFAVLTGPTTSPLGTIDTIDTPVGGLDSVTNEEVAVLGRNLETDNELRVRRAESLRVAGSSTPDAIRAAVRNVTGVSTVSLVENKTNAVDGGGRPPKSFEVIVEGGADLDIAQSIQDNRPAGIETFGAVGPITAIDSEGENVDIFFSRPTAIDIELEIDYTLYAEETPPVGIETAIADAALAFGNALAIGVDVIPQRFFGAIYDSANGIGEIEVRARISPAAFSTDTISIAGSERALFNIGTITVTLIP